MELKSSRILVTGGTGFLGRVVVRRLRACGADVGAIGTARVDLTNYSEVLYLVSQEKPDAVVHLAALCGGIGANRAAPADFLTANALMGLHVLRACMLRTVPKLLLLGSICAYPKLTPVPFHEEDLWNGYPEETNAPYGVAKRMLLVAAQAYRQQYGLNAIMLFPTNLYGPGDRFDGTTNHVIPALVARMEQARRSSLPAIQLWGDGTPTREFLYVEDCAAAVVRALEVYDAPEPLNVGSGEEVSIRRLAELIAEATGYAGRLEWDPGYPNGQPRRLVDSRRAHAALGWRAEVDLVGGLERTVAAYRGLP